MRKALNLAFFLLIVSFAWSLPLEYNFVREFGSKGSKPGEFNYPVSITIDRYQNIFITDWNNYQVVKCDRNGKFIKSFAPDKTDRLKFGFNKKFRPIGIIATKNDLLYVSDQNNEAVFIFDLNGIMISAFGGRGSINGKFKDPRGLAADKDGNIYVADYSNSRIQIFDKNGKFIRKIKIMVKKRYYLPRSLVVQPDGDMWIVLSSGNIVAKFSKKGEFIKSIGKYGNGGGDFNQPRYISSDIDGNLYITDRKNNRVEIFSKNGEYFGEFGQKGKSRGEFNSPEGIWVDYNGNILVVDADNDRIQEFGSPPETAHLYLGKYYESASLFTDAFNEYMELLKYDGASKLAKQKIKEIGIDLMKKYISSGELEKAKDIYNKLSQYYTSDEDIEAVIANAASNNTNTDIDGNSEKPIDENLSKNSLPLKLAIFVIVFVVGLLIFAISAKKQRKKSKKRGNSEKINESIEEKPVIEESKKTDEKSDKEESTEKEEEEVEKK